MHHFGLVGDAVELYVGRQEDRSLCQLFIYFLTEGNDVISGHHLHVQDKAGLTVVGHILRRFLITAGDGRYVLEPQGSAGDRIGPNDLFLHLVLGLIRDEYLQILSVLLTAYGTQALQG